MYTTQPVMNDRAGHGVNSLNKMSPTVREEVKEIINVKMAVNKQS
jgi:hypothetical protein